MFVFACKWQYTPYQIVIISALNLVYIVGRRTEDSGRANVLPCKCMGMALWTTWSVPHVHRTLSPEHGEKAKSMSEGRHVRCHANKIAFHGTTVGVRIKRTQTRQFRTWAHVVGIEIKLSAWGYGPANHNPRIRVPVPKLMHGGGILATFKDEQCMQTYELTSF